MQGPFSKYVAVEGEGGVNEIRDKPLRKLSGQEGVKGLGCRLRLWELLRAVPEVSKL